METPIHITRTERVDDIPLLLAQMDKMNIAALLNKHFPMHGNWQGLSFGETVVAWLAYILSEGEHRLGHSKEHRPDLPQLKINQLVLDRFGIPLTIIYNNKV